MSQGLTVYAVTTSCSHRYVTSAVLYSEVSRLSLNSSPKGAGLK
jgi:hypothetical protein